VLKGYVGHPGSDTAPQALGRSTAINAEVQDDVLVRAKPLVLVIGPVEALLELLVQGHDMVRLWRPNACADRLDADRQHVAG
jgi:hypothetical protein